MELLREILAGIAFTLAGIFTLGGIIGLFRFPDAYTRLQAGSLAGTTSVISVFIGALILAPDWAIAGRIVIIIIFFLLSSPTGAHIVARFAWNSDLPAWKPRDQKRSGPERKMKPRRKRRLRNIMQKRLRRNRRQGPSGDAPEDME
ncbi:monovalent cation/H(+) antiporter subunit G [Salinispira pacifica]|uniref:Na(+) H(+) antiporter subunit G n=1 Tax=Salinispira pacifica TaxID=1307761 RepID=V5WIB1_9SPIO|nr:monovalent cation/H(+) antiporter subunit G [Salinispira pacifica]AHC15370.1 Na(+) H(+) antiporter subunit G [Salinispira pacifica]